MKMGPTKTRRTTGYSTVLLNFVNTTIDLILAQIYLYIKMVQGLLYNVLWEIEGISSALSAEGIRGFWCNADRGVFLHQEKQGDIS